MATVTKDINEWLPKIDQVASFFSQDFPDVEYDDVRSDLIIFVLENKHLNDPEHGVVGTALRRRAQAYAWDQRREHLTLSVQYSYRPSDVRRLLETLGNYRTWPNAKTPEDAKSRRGNDSIEMSADVSRAFAKLRGPYQDVIRSRYFSGTGNTFETGSAESKRLSRAIAALCDILNFYSYETADRRVVMSNAQARSLLDNQWDN